MENLHSLIACSARKQVEVSSIFEGLQLPERKCQVHKQALVVVSAMVSTRAH
jgi:hypothetical protein